MFLVFLLPLSPAIEMSLCCAQNLCTIQRKLKTNKCRFLNCHPRRVLPLLNSMVMHAGNTVTDSIAPYEQCK